MMKFPGGTPLFGIERIHFVREPAFREVRITKLERTEVATRAEWESATGGRQAGWRNLPVGYSMQGTLLQPLAVGAMMCVLRRTRNGMPVRGLFVSSPVVRIEGERVVTTIGTYRVVCEPCPRSSI